MRLFPRTRTILEWTQSFRRYGTRSTVRKVNKKLQKERQLATLLEQELRHHLLRIKELTEYHQQLLHRQQELTLVLKPQEPPQLDPKAMQAVQSLLKPPASPST